MPVSSKTVTLSDVVTVTDASYDGATLTIAANSSDPAATLTVKGYGDLTAGAASFTGVDAPPHVITVTSNEGGSATVPLATSGPFTAPDPPVAAVVASPNRPIAGQPVTLDASGSLDATSFEWTLVSKPALADAHPPSSPEPRRRSRPRGQACTSSRSSRSATPDGARRSP